MTSRVEQLSARLKQALRDGRDAIIGRGGSINSTAGFRDFPSAIYNIPADNALATVKCEEVSLSCLVPSNTTGYAYIAEFGGISRGGDGSIYDEALDHIVSWGAGGEIDRFKVPPEILALPGYGDGISLDYYNKVDLVNRKYVTMIDTFVLDGTDPISSNQNSWSWGVGPGSSTNYFRCRLGDYGTYVNDVIVCDRYAYTNITSSTTSIGVDLVNSTSGVNSGSLLAIRPNNILSFTDIKDVIPFIKANPIVIKVARKVPIEMDLPVYVNPLIKVEPSEMGLELFPSQGDGIPHKIIMQTRVK